MKPAARLITLTCLLAASAGPVMAACPQGKAIYADVDGLYQLAFSPVGSDAAATSHGFTITVKKANYVLDGHVMASDPLGRPVGTIFDHCPDGDVTGEDIAACTVWEGSLYSLDKGQIDILPGETDEATAAILLPGFGDALVNSRAFAPGKATQAPWDVFTLTGCAS